MRHVWLLLVGIGFETRAIEGLALQQSQKIDRYALSAKRSTQERRSQFISRHSGGFSEEKKGLMASLVYRIRSEWSEARCLSLLVGIVVILFGALASTRNMEGPPCLTLREIIAGGSAAAIAEITLYPIEVLKVRLQTGASRTKLFTWQRPGVVAGTLRALSYHGLRLGLFPAVKRLLGGDAAADLGTKLFVGAACGALGAIIVNPLDLAKTRLQRDPKRYQNSFDALLSLPRQKGGAWIGANAAIARAAAGSSAQLAAYDLTKSFFSPQSSPLVAVLLGALVASAAYVLAAAPFDVVKSRIMVASSSTKQKDTSFLACLVDIVRTDGLPGLFRGSFPAFLRLLPTTLLVFPLLERFRIFLGAGAF